MAKVFLDIDITSPEDDAWREGHARLERFLAAEGAQYALPAAAAELSDEQKETALELYASVPARVEEGGGRCTPPPPARKGRLVIELDAKAAPKAAENLRCLCTGEKGKGKSGKALHLKGTPFHRIKKGFMVQGGDLVKGDGSGGDSIYGPKFNDDKAALKLKHAARGVVGMANSGKNSNNSQFYVTFAAAPQLDGKHVVVGRVVEGLEVLDAMEAVAGDGDGPPLKAIRVADCGQL